jgi:RNA-binding protein Musashi
MDVYLPRDKVNRSEHRGFGFVTFETEAAVLRIHAHGQHQIKCVPALHPAPFNMVA